MNSAPARAYVALGSNLGDRLATLRSAVSLLDGRWSSGTRVLRRSRIYETRPMGPSDFAFLNAVVEVETSSAPPALLASLLDLERKHGRERSQRWAARTLDLDLLFYWDTPAGPPIVLDVAGLTLPHPEISHRDFVLAPLRDLDPDLVLPPGSTVAQTLAQLPLQARTIEHALPAAWEA